MAHQADEQAPVANAVSCQTQDPDYHPDEGISECTTSCVPQSTSSAGESAGTIEGEPSRADASTEPGGGRMVNQVRVSRPSDAPQMPPAAEVYQYGLDAAEPVTDDLTMHALRNVRPLGWSDGQLVVDLGADRNAATLRKLIELETYIGAPITTWEATA